MTLTSCFETYSLAKQRNHNKIRSFSQYKERDKQIRENTKKSTTLPITTHHAEKVHPSSVSAMSGTKHDS